MSDNICQYDPDVLRERWTFIQQQWNEYIAPYFRSGIHQESVDQYINFSSEPDLVPGFKFMFDASTIIRRPTLKKLVVWLMFHFLSSYEILPGKIRDIMTRKAVIFGRKHGLFIGWMIGLNQDQQTTFDDLIREHHTWRDSIEIEAV